MNPRPLWLISRSVLTEAVRRREIYAVILISVFIIGGVMTIDFFGLEGLTKFYREVALKIMSAATALTVIVLAARQLPREFEQRTIYPLLARPISRAQFLAGKLLGVMLAAAFCLALFLAIYLIGALYLKSEIPWALFAQYVCLQMLMMLVLATLSFWLSMIMHLDAAITIGVIFYTMANTLITMTSYIYDFVPAAGQWVLRFLIFALPQLPLFDLSEKAVHSAAWGPLSVGTMAALIAYGFFFGGVYFSFALVCFRRRAI